MKLITWLDIVSYDGTWLPLGEAEEYKPAPMETVGWIIKNEPEYLVVASSKGGEDLVGSVSAIPKSVIESIECVAPQCSKGCLEGKCKDVQRN